MSRLALAEHDRAIQQAIRIGRVAALDAAAARVQVAIGELVTGWIPWLTLRAGPDASWWAPEPGEQVLVLTPGGRGEQAVALPAVYSDAHPAPAAAATVRRDVYADGAVVEYDRAAHRLRATLPAGGAAVLVAPGGVTIEGDVTVAGTVTVSEDVVASGISLVTHRHTGITPGGALTGEPA
jgi:phage baseplate assembly protein V